MSNMDLLRSKYGNYIDIWEGVPVIPKFEDGIIIFEFPEGPLKTMSIQQTANVIAKALDGKVIEVTEKSLKIKPDPKRVGETILMAFIRFAIPLFHPEDLLNNKNQGGVQR